ncbi:MAG: hypothetical protein K2F87_01120, partial [Muribaculaceae bacterium]|nr:hypothetical protein [Muribaculaceae bacterium]
DTKKMKLKDMVVQSRARNIDTLRIGSGASPVLLWYWRREDSDRKRAVDSLRRVLKWRPDSASMIVADIALMSDSAQWNFSSRQDSLDGAVRVFAPRGLADPDIMTMGVHSTPWFIVASGKGKAAYSGPDLDKAMAAFRKLRPKKPKS